MLSSGQSASAGWADADPARGVGVVYSLDGRLRWRFESSERSRDPGWRLHGCGNGNLGWLGSNHDEG